MYVWCDSISSIIVCLIVLHCWAFLFLFFSFLVRKIPFAGIRTHVPRCQKVTRLFHTSELPGRPGTTVVVFFTSTDRASTIPSNIRGCQSGTWSQRGTKVNGSYHGDNPLLRPTGIQIATKSYATLQAMAPTNNKTVHQTIFTPHNIESNLDRLGLLSPTHDYILSNYIMYSTTVCSTLFLVGFCCCGYRPSKGRPAHTQRLVQLPEVHPRTVRPTERSSRAQNPDAKSRGTRDNALRLRHLEPARVPLRHAAPSPPRVVDSLHWLAKAQSRRPPDFLSGHACQDGKGEHRGDFTQKADLVCGICGAHGGYETAEVRDVRRNGGGRGLRGGPGKRVMICFLDDLRAFGINADQWIAAAQDGAGWRRTTEQGVGHFMAKWIVAEKAEAGLRHAMVCPNVTGRTKEKIAQKKAAGSCWFARPC